MPRVKPPKAEDMNRHTRAVLMDFMEMHGCHDVCDLKKFIGVSETTARARWKDPESLRIGEIRQLKGLSDEQIVRMVRGRMPEKQEIKVYINGIKQ